MNGEMVLVPVLYLAQADGRLGPTGALIAGNDVSLIAGQNLDNVGTLRAANNLSAAAGNDLVNSGLIEAGNRLDLLAGNDLINKAGGIIAGRDVTLTAIRGDVINERTVTSHQSAADDATWRKDFADSAARIEAANDMSLQAGRDVKNTGGVLQAGRDLSIAAGRDVVIDSAQTENGQTRGANASNSSITQLGSTVSAGRDLTAQAGRDINVIASSIDAKRDIAMAATENLTLSSAADEQHSYGKSKKVTEQEDHVSQVSADLKAGGSVALQAGQNLAVISSRITAGKEAYLVAGENLDILAAQDSDYSLYDMKKKGSFGAKKTQRDEVTDVKNIGSEITTGGDLLLSSGGDQKYQVAKLESGKDLTIESGGAVTFEGVKDLHQESHEKSKSDLAWNSSKGKGNTDETLRQSELVAKGEVAIRAVEGLKIDIKQVDQLSVSQTIDAMVKADPQLAWLKEAEKRGDVDWRQVKEVHESFKYSNSGLGAGAQLVIAILVTYFTAGLASGLIGAGATLGSGTAMAAAGTASASAVAGGAAVGSTVAAGWANVALTAVATGAASNAAISTINNRGNLGKVVKDVTSKDAVRGYAVSGITAGLTAAAYDQWTSTHTGTSGALPNGGKVVTSSGLSSIEGAGRFAANQVLQNTTSTIVDRALGGDSQFSDALRSSLANTFAAVGFNWVGTFSDVNKLPESGAAKIALHAIMGGLAAEAAGGDFKTGALAGGVNEALVDSLANQYSKMDKDQRSKLLIMNSQLIGVLAASAQGGDGKSLQTGSWVAGSATSYNRLLHSTEKRVLTEEAKALESRLGKPSSSVSWGDLLLLASSAELDAKENARLQALLTSYGAGNPEGARFAEELLIAKTSVGRLAAQNIVLTWDDGSTIIADGEAVHAFQSTTSQFKDAGLFNTASQWSQSGANNWADEPSVVPAAWQEQFGDKNAAIYLRELAKVSSSQGELDDLVQRVSGVLSGGVDRVTWDLDAALALTGAPAVLRALLAKRAAAAGIVDAGAVAAGKAELDGIAQTPKGSDLAGKQSGTALDAQPQKIDGAKGPAGGLPSGETKVVGDGTQAANDASFAGAKGPASDLPSGETKVVGNGTPAANDASFEGPKATTNAPNTPRFITDSAGNTIDLGYTKGLRETNVTVTGTRGGVQYPLQGQTPDSYANLGNGHVVVYGPEGRALYDVSSSRIKVVEWNQAPNGTYFPKKGSDTKVFEGNVPQSVLDSLGLK
ncbi:DUF637 domain-containing protein [Pseudomonas viridiflava]|uniref:DUF637 domain-containing protein n=1 Tax=Pseudomonas viridiflava TaxID=33069 RepID=UPI001F146BA6|nr:DUF637 domain-containing protein [Pseudomonas viridiflava]